MNFNKSVCELIRLCSRFKHAVSHISTLVSRKDAISGYQTPDVFVGGLGGSGTRVFADVLRDAGINMGYDLNESLDDLTFTLLLKRPLWALEAPYEAWRQHIHVYSKLRCGVKLRADEDALLKLAYLDMQLNGHNRDGDGKGAWATARYSAAKSYQQGAQTKWGWKEPNSVLFANDILTLYPSTKFVFVIRHGLDMAFSGNQQQLFNWYARFDLPDPRLINEDKLPSLMLDYWIAVAEMVTALQAKYSKQRVVIIRFEDLFDSSLDTIPHLYAFLDIAIPENKYQLTAPQSVGRYKHRNLDCFTPSQFDKLRAFGYEI